MAKVQPNENGVYAVNSKSGKIRIVRQGCQVWGLYTGTHDLAPVSRNFKTEDEARKYANELWRTR